MYITKYALSYNLLLKNIQTFFDFSVVNKMKNLIESGSSYSVEHCIIS